MGNTLTAGQMEAKRRGPGLAGAEESELQESGTRESGKIVKKKIGKEAGRIRIPAEAELCLRLGLCGEPCRKTQCQGRSLPGTAVFLLVDEAGTGGGGTAAEVDLAEAAAHGEVGGHFDVLVL